MAEIRLDGKVAVVTGAADLAAHIRCRLRRVEQRWWSTTWEGQLTGQGLEKQWPSRYAMR